MRTFVCLFTANQAQNHEKHFADFMLRKLGRNSMIKMVFIFQWRHQNFGIGKSLIAAFFLALTAHKVETVIIRGGQKEV